MKEKQMKNRSSEYLTCSQGSAAYRLVLKGLASLRRWLFARLTNFVTGFFIGIGLALALNLTCGI